MGFLGKGRDHYLGNACSLSLGLIFSLPQGSPLVGTNIRPASIYARLNTKATDRALQAQADRFCRSISSAGFIEQHSPSGMKGEQDVVPLRT